MIVVDASAVVARLAGRPPNDELAERLGAETTLHAPHLLDVEVLSALRGLVLGAKLSLERASQARRDFRDLAIVRYGHEPLADHMWALRSSLSAYDAAYVSLAATLRATLVTCDRRLASAAAGTPVEVYPAQTPS